MKRIHRGLILLLLLMGTALVFSQEIVPVKDSPSPPSTVDNHVVAEPEKVPARGEEAHLHKRPFTQEGQERVRPRQQQPRREPEVLYLNPDQEEETLEYLKEFHPDQAGDLLLLKARRPERYWTVLSRAFREMRYLEGLKEKDPERYERVSREKKLEREAWNLSRKYRQTEDDNEKVRLREELKSLLDQVFDYRQMNRQEEIEKLEKRLAELKENNQRRLANKNEIVQRRLKQLLGDEKGMEW